MTASVWTAGHINGIGKPWPELPLIRASDVVPVLPHRDVWDMWPLTDADGITVPVAGGVLWFGLAAPKFSDPVTRHLHARLHLLWQHGGDWIDCGAALPDGFSPGDREWSGSAIVDLASGTVTLFFTAAGRRGRALSYLQRLFQCSGQLDVSGAQPAIRSWSNLHESVACDFVDYAPTDQSHGAPGTIKAFRDPAFFRDPADSASYLLFAASLQKSTSAFNGAVGIARADDAALASWSLLPPLIHADGLNNELERPHMLVRDGLYYLFWSTQRSVFAPGGPSGPTGLYGMVAPALFGPYRALNGTGLVCANPTAEPDQAFAWWVSGDLQVTSFIDYWGLAGRKLATAPALRRTQFGGTMAPSVQLELSGDRAHLVRA